VLLQGAAWYEVVAMLLLLWSLSCVPPPHLSSWRMPATLLVFQSLWVVCSVCLVCQGCVAAVGTPAPDLSLAAMPPP
jgi:hypothetical protein